MRKLRSCVVRGAWGEEPPSTIYELMRVIGIDYGSARVGIALGDTESRVASPWTVLQNTNEEQLILDIKDLMKRESADLLVVGIPHPLADLSRVSKQSQVILDFIERLKLENLPVETYDEMLTSRIAERQMIERGERGKRDDLAAAAILQGWLDAFVA
jgi:putative holliday junction resolvase